MDSLFNFMSVLMIIFSIFILRMIIKNEKDEVNIESISIDKNLSIMKEYFCDKNTSCEGLSGVASALCFASYFLVHMLVNKGKNYDDKLQAKGYIKSLTKKNIELINSINGYYE